MKCLFLTGLKHGLHSNLLVNCKKHREYVNALSGIWMLSPSLPDGLAKNASFTQPTHTTRDYQRKHFFGGGEKKIHIVLQPSKR